jgi:hypothetical protein
MVSALAHYTRPSGQGLDCSTQRFLFFFGEFSQPGDQKKKRKGLANPTNEFFEILRKTFAIS